MTLLLKSVHNLTGHMFVRIISKLCDVKSGNESRTVCDEFLVSAQEEDM